MVSFRKEWVRRSDRCPRVFSDCRSLVPRAEDVLLVRAAQQGDLRAFEALVHRYRNPVYRIALRMLGDAAAAEDAVQDAFLRAWLALPEFRAESSIGTWLYRIVTNRCLNILRAERPVQPLEDDQAVAAARPEELVQQQAELGALRRAILRLTPEQRAAFVLRELEGLSYEEIAEVLGATVPAIKGRIHRARLELVEAMRQWR